MTTAARSKIVQKYKLVRKIKKLEENPMEKQDMSAFFSLFRNEKLETMTALLSINESIEKKRDVMNNNKSNGTDDEDYCDMGILPEGVTAGRMALQSCKGLDPAKVCITYWY